MKNYVIVMDAAGDVCKELVKNNDIRCIPMQYSLGDEMRTSSLEESPEILKKFYDGQRGGDLTRTSQITPFMYEEFFSPILNEGKSILYISLSSGLSSTFNSVCLAKESLKETYPNVDVYAVDSLSATGGIGILLEKAVSNKAAGMSILENYNSLNECVKNLCNWFMVQDLNYLKRGGRISATTAILGSMLNIKPILKIDEVGKLTTISKKHGNKAAVKHLFELTHDNLDLDACPVVYIHDADSRELSDYLAKMLIEAFPNAIVKQGTLSPIIGAHTGPGMVMVSYLSK